MTEEEMIAIKKLEDAIYNILYKLSIMENARNINITDEDVETTLEKIESTLSFLRSPDAIVYVRDIQRNLIFALSSIQE